eukprot:Seg976.3 transcript_id=Seg976.3/GoldUCD/mRNA.D3Y31 product="Mitochondrial fission process protein 1" protein_id=Seg976.3/GoldUCD/D3Y31
MADDVASISKDKDVDLFRETPIRLLGYANEVGEAFRALVPRWLVNSSYAVASLYCFADASSKGLKSYQNSEIEPEQKNRRSVEVFLEAAIWQAFASVIIPGFTINRLCRLSNISLSRLAPAVPLITRDMLTTVVGLGSIPFIIKPIDRLVDTAMEQAAPYAKQILQQEAVIEESIHVAVEGRTDAIGEWSR